jgi:hypothetical protein
MDGVYATSVAIVFLSRAIAGRELMDALGEAPFLTYTDARH